MEGFIIDRTYRVENGQPKVYCFGRLKNGESFLTINDFLPYFYLRAKDRKKAEKLVVFRDLAETGLKNFAGEPVIQATVAEPKLVPEVRKLLEDAKIPTFEADIRFTQRFLMERGIMATMRIEGDHAKDDRFRVDRVYRNPTISPCEAEIQLRILSLDLEASHADDGKLYCVALYGVQGKKRYKEVLFVANKQTHPQKIREQIADIGDVAVMANEKELLEKLRERILRYDPDILTGWNVIDFDLAFLKKKYERYKLQPAWGRNGDTIRLRLESLFSRDSKADITGRMVLDGIQLLRSSFVDLDSYKLDNAAHEILGERKLISGKNKVKEIKRQYAEEPAKLVAYNLKDAELVIKILDAKRIIELTMLRSRLVGLPMERVRASIASLDSVYLRELHEAGFVAPNAVYQEKEEMITGGFVKESQPGIYDYVIVLDFKSLYPSVIRTFNIDPLDHRPGCKGRTGEKLLRAPNKTCFVDRDGILPKLLQRLWEERDKAKQRKDSVASYAIKILMNSFFGVMASPNCRFFSLELANAITHYAQHFLKLTIEEVGKQGYDVIYGDTDSVFVDLDVKSYDEAEKIGLRIQKDINNRIARYIKKEYGRTSYLELEFEKVYRKFLMPRTRGTQEGSKKRYAGLLVTKRKNGKLDEAMDFTGMEFVRRDWTGLAKEFQLTLLKKIFHDEEVAGFVKRFVADLRKGTYDDLLVYRKAVRKSLDSYVKTTPPHVKAARILVEKEGKLSSNVIEYVMTANGPEPAEHRTASIDYDHYLEKQIRPIADSVLGFFGTNFDDLMKGSKQQTLSGF